MTEGAEVMNETEFIDTMLCGAVNIDHEGTRRRCTLEDGHTDPHMVYIPEYGLRIRWNLEALHDRQDRRDTA